MSFNVLLMFLIGLWYKRVDFFAVMGEISDMFLNLVSFAFDFNDVKKKVQVNSLAT